MKLVDSCGYIEFFRNGNNAEAFVEAIEDFGKLIVPVLCIYEVYKHMLVYQGKKAALQCITAMQKGIVIDCSQELMLNAVSFGVQYQLPMADSIIYATACQQNAIVLTKDKHFKGLPGVKFVE